MTACIVGPVSTILNAPVSTILNADYTDDTDYAVKGVGVILRPSAFCQDDNVF